VTKTLLLLSVLVAALLVACSGETTTAPATPAGYPAPTLVQGYPEPPTPLPTLEGYPELPTAAPLVGGYPAGTTFWVLHPAGAQCEEPLTYPDLESATSALQEAGVTPLAAEEADLLVCEACGCPTSRHYRVQIDVADLGQAESLGWSRE